jgi:CheY-like chemotaxis protein
LERFGYRVLLASNGAEAVSLFALQKDQIAAVITDMEMPIMGGPATVFALKAISPGVKLIGSSGLSSNRSINKALGAGVAQFIPKPYTTDILLKALQRVLRRGPPTAA